MNHRFSRPSLFVMILVVASILVSPALAKGTVSGVITDRDGTPQEKIRVMILPSEENESALSYSPKTNGKGRYLAMVDNGAYVLNLDDESIGISELTIVAEDKTHEVIFDWTGRVLPGQPSPEFQVASGYKVVIDIVSVDTKTLNEEYANYLLSGVASALERGDRAAALETVEDLLENRPNDPVGLTLRAYMHTEEGRFDEAEADLSAALAQKPDMLDAKYQLAALYRSTDRKEQALALFREVGASTDPQQKARALLNVGEMERDEKNYQAAVAAFEGAVEAMPEIAPQVTPELISLYTALGETERAEELLAAAPSPDEIDPSIQYNVAVAHFNRKEYEEAAELFRGVIEADPAMADAHRTLGYSLLNLGKQAEALDAFKKYLELEPEGAQSSEVTQIVEALSSIVQQ